MPKRKTFLVLKMDDKMLKKTKQSELVQTNLEQLLQDISLPGHEDPMVRTDQIVIIVLRHLLKSQCSVLVILVTFKRHGSTCWVMGDQHMVLL